MEVVLRQSKERQIRDAQATRAEAMRRTHNMTCPWKVTKRCLRRMTVRAPTSKFHLQMIPMRLGSGPMRCPDQKVYNRPVA